jgi:hypothetical protein
LLPYAQYAIVNWVDGVLGIELRRVPIDLDAVKQAALTGDMPGAAYWAEWWITPEKDIANQAIEALRNASRITFQRARP